MTRNVLRATACAVLLLGLLLLGPACEKTDEMSPGASSGPLKFETSSFNDAIPLTYGKLVGVTAHPENAHWAALWFVDADSTISVVWVNVVDRKIQGNVLRIPRR